VALPYLRERPLDEPPPPADAGVEPVLAARVQPRPRQVQLLEGSPAQIAARIDDLAAAGGSVVVAAGRGAGDDLGPYRELARRYGGALAVSRPQVEAGRATRAELVGASSNTVSPDVYIAFGISGSLPHLIGMAESRMVIAINTDRGARIFDHADIGAVVDAGEVIRSIREKAPDRVTQ
jgi:electron transfer flavoprotein alpha subunit